MGLSARILYFRRNPADSDSEFGRTRYTFHVVRDNDKVTSTQTSGHRHIQLHSPEEIKPSLLFIALQHL